MTKKIAVVFGLMACLVYGISAQGIRAGFKTGINISSQRFSGIGIPTGTQSLSGLHGGIYVITLFSDHVDIQSEVLVSIQGAKLDYSGTHYTDRLAYITVPLLLRYNTNRLISFHAGPQLGILGSAKEESGGSTFDTRSDFKNTDFSLVFGGTIDLPLKLDVTLRYCLGISDVDRNTGSTTKNNLFQLSLGYRLFGADE